MPTGKIKGLDYDYAPNIKPPIMPIDKEFSWTDELVREYATRFLCEKVSEKIPTTLEQFKQSKTKQRDWEIVAIRCIVLGELFEKQKSGLFRIKRLTHECEEWTEEFLLGYAKDYEIFSVKRLSDNEVFSIGDYVLDNISELNMPICEFKVFGDDVMVCGKNLSWNLSLNNLQKAKPILFTTSDGVAIYSWHDVIWFVNSAWYIGSKQAADYDVEKLSHIRYFSTEVAAKEYVSYNKPCLSAKDVCQITAIYGVDFVPIEKEVIRLAKSKL